MEQFIKDFMNELAKSPKALSEGNKKKIHEYIPVPNDFDILWADINSFGGYPSGIVLTDRGIVCKAPRYEGEQNKDENKNEKVYRIPYQIMLWEYFDPSDFLCEKAEKGDGYVLRKDDQTIAVFQDKSLIAFFHKVEEKLKLEEDLLNGLVDGAVISEMETLNMEKTR